GFAGGTYDLNAGSALTGAGALAFDFGTAANVRGGISLTGPVSIGSGSSTLGATANFFDTVNGTGAATFASLNLTRGALTGSAAIQKSGGTCTGTAALAVNNSGSVAVQAGTLALGAVTNAGSFTLLGGGTAAVASFTQTAGALNGNGVVVGNVVINGGVVGPG